MNINEIKVLLYRSYALGFESGVNSGKYHDMELSWGRQKYFFEKDIESIQLTSETPIIDKLKREVDILRMLLDDPHPREKTWVSAYYGQVDKLMEFWSGSSSQQEVQDVQVPGGKKYRIFPSD